MASSLFIQAVNTNLIMFLTKPVFFFVSLSVMLEISHELVNLVDWNFQKEIYELTYTNN